MFRKVLLVLLTLLATYSFCASVQENEYQIKMHVVNVFGFKFGKVTLTVTNNGSESGLNISVTDVDTDLSLGRVEGTRMLPFNIDAMDDQIAMSWTYANASSDPVDDSLGIDTIDFTAKDSAGKEVTKTFSGHCYAQLWRRTIVTTKCCCHGE